MEWWKMQTFTERKVEKQENIECIEMYRNVSDKKIELYMYNSKKWSYTFLYIPIRRFWGKGFWKSMFFFCFCLTKKCGPMGRDCWNQTVHISYNLGFKIWQVRHNGPQWFKSKGMHLPQTTLFWARQADWKVSTGLTSADVAKSWPGFTTTAAAHWAAFIQIRISNNCSARLPCSIIKFPFGAVHGTAH